MLLGTHVVCGFKPKATLMGYQRHFVLSKIGNFGDFSKSGFTKHTISLEVCIYNNQFFVVSCLVVNRVGRFFCFFWFIWFFWFF